uniref:Uncharacterized protein n=1 Tax=Chromera velia CCMP2878 TaxID=1169474 RepID=A0A0G4G2T1_9ALVE|eukprot:Cvel_19994.t1-p1 / transcript=Cvel_19994.t1 / gene=Cvel_19994 / organism=Chromera_velia_CCMP2878 / gene_product=hypothetical protein / transcript_product=hypothetical protein / location=Cvel_scaffold1762:10555-10758(-) / protein_length=68 / sequence_SO=supercontig / SO=protein_coding / is_pseudo=false
MSGRSLEIPLRNSSFSSTEAALMASSTSEEETGTEEANTRDMKQKTDVCRCRLLLARSNDFGRREDIL